MPFNGDTFTSVLESLVKFLSLVVTSSHSPLSLFPSVLLPRRSLFEENSGLLFMYHRPWPKHFSSVACPPFRKLAKEAPPTVSASEQSEVQHRS